MTPPTISRVLVGVDFDEPSAAALRMADALASAWQADVTLLHASTPEAPAYFTAAQIGALEAEREQSRAVTADDLRAFAAQHCQRPVHVAVEDGPPQDAILQTAAAFDVIVVGTHRRHGPIRWWLGSVAEAVVRDSPRPVLVVPAGAAVPDPRRGFSILADGSDGVVTAWADALKTAFGGTVMRALDIRHSAHDRLQHADLIVLATPAAGAHGEFGATVQVLKECVYPVLFIPSAGGIAASASEQERAGGKDT